MPNLFFFSLQNDLEIKYAKISVKFDNSEEGKARFSFKLWLKKENLGETPELYLLVNNKEIPVALENIDEQYNKRLKEEDFRKAAGIDDTKKEKEHEEFTIEVIKEFEEDNNLVNKKIIHPKTMSVTKTFPTILPEEMSIHIERHRDLLLNIKPLYFEKIKGVEDTLAGALIEFQFRIFFRDFTTPEILSSWKSSSEPWSVDIDIHKKRNFKDIFHYFKDVLKYPKNLDLWITIPHDHLFIASSPAHSSAIKLKKEDILYKTHEINDYEEHSREKEFYKKFETKEGDYSVKISSNDGKPEEFSIICMSPFLPGEKPHELKESISKFMKKTEDVEKEFKKESEKFVKWEDIISSLVLLLAIISLIFSIPAYKGGFSDELTDLILESIIFGIVLWVVWLTCEKIGRVIWKRFEIGKIMMLIIIIILTFIIKYIY